MDEVDKIIIHSLEQIGCKIGKYDDSEVFGLKHFTPDLLVRAVSKCLQEIKQDVVLPKALPENMAQRFTVATTLAEICSASGYRGDIGYQTFLYPNEVDIRRLFMFLIEQLPKEQICNLDDSHEEDKNNDFDYLMHDVRKKIILQLKSPWVPQYCRSIGNRKIVGCSSLSVRFFPQLNLNVPENEKSTQRNEVQSLVNYQVPSIFQQISVGDFDLISSVLHKNAIDTFAQSAEPLDVRLSLTRTMYPIIYSPANLLLESLEKQKSVLKEEILKKRSIVEKATDEVEMLKQQNNQVAKEHKTANIKLNQLRQQRSETHAQIESLKMKTKIFERTSMILENPEQNINKLERLIEKTRERRLAVENQWQLHRNPAILRIDELRKLWQSKNIQSMQEIESKIEKLKTALAEKNHNHAILEEEFRKAPSNVASRKEYTRRIYEFLSNIRKQRNDIYKILDDTKDLQKQLNSVSAQLQRQFNYTDDLLFQSAKHDLHGKQAYKLLASLHTSCDEISDLVLRTGQMTKDLRELEVQIDRERMHNVASSLEKITLDLHKFEMVIKTIKSDINRVENEIRVG